jgi:hypothetical protein
MLAGPNDSFRPVVAAARIAQTNYAQVFIIQFRERAKVDARSRVVIRAGKIQAKDGETG